MRRLLFISLFLFSLPAAARTPDEAELLALRYLGGDFAGWIKHLPQPPESISIFHIYPNPPLDQDYSYVLEREIVKSLSDVGIKKVVACIECRRPSVTLRDDKVIVSNALPDQDTIKRLAKTQRSEAILVIDIYRTGLSVLAHAELFETQTGELISAERFTVPALNVSESAAHLLLTFGLGMILPKPDASTQDPTMSGSLSLLEEVGFGKAGLTLGGLISPGSGTLIYLDPTLALRTRLGNSGLGLATFLGAGYGFTGSIKGLHLRSSIELYWGSLAVFGIEGNYFLTQGSSTPPFTSFVGFHVGIGFGR